MDDLETPRAKPSCSCVIPELLRACFRRDEKFFIEIVNSNVEKDSSRNN